MFARARRLLTRSPIPSSLLLAALLPLAGCGPGPATVTGTVKQANDAALPMGSIRFISQVSGHPSRSGPIEEGRYTVEGVLAGPNVIVIETPPMPPNPSNPSKYVTVPNKYTDPDKSDLRLDVHGPTQTFDVILKP